MTTLSREAAPPANAELAKERKHWLHWIGYLVRTSDDNEVDFMQLLSKEYGEWGQQVLGQARNYHSYYGELPKDYMRRAVRQASLRQLQELRAIRYILQHPVRDGVPYSGNCTRVVVCALRPKRAGGLLAQEGDRAQ